MHNLELLHIIIPKSNRGHCSFAVPSITGTLVATKVGLVPIENIHPGDLVWATDEETGETAFKEAGQIFFNETEKWVHDAMNGIYNLTNSERIWIFENEWGG